MNTEWEYWDCEMRFSKAALSNLTRSLVLIGGHFTDSDVTQYHGSPEGYWPVLFRIKLPSGMKQEFESLSRLVCQEPPKIQIDCGFGE